ncbi:hypothetical protein U1Q18_027625, partial [Sarracenia purpurea var. burkii]
SNDESVDLDEKDLALFAKKLHESVKLNKGKNSNIFSPSSTLGQKGFTISRIENREESVKVNIIPTDKNEGSNFVFLRVAIHSRESSDPNTLTTSTKSNFSLEVESSCQGNKELENCRDENEIVSIQRVHEELMKKYLKLKKGQ